MTWLNVGAGTHNAPSPWVNVDVTEQPDVHPDVIVEPGEPLPWGDNTVERIFAGHVLEHMPWPDTLGYLLDLRRVLQPGGELLVVGPDVLRCIERYKHGLEPWEMIHSVLEYHDRNTGFETSDWPNARHWWNCWETRVLEVVEQAGFVDVTPIPPPDGVYWADGIPGWPVVGWAPWQCAVLTRKAS